MTEKLMFQTYFEVFYSLCVEGAYGYQLLPLELMTIEDPSPSAQGYQLLPLAISQ